ncbi:MAG: ATP-binding protein [Candidatus Omnitrophota bacterium]
MEKKDTVKITVSGINIEWDTMQGTFTLNDLPATMMWLDVTVSRLMNGLLTMVGAKRFSLSLQSEGRKSIEEDWKIISRYSDFQDGFKELANVAAVAGWGQWHLTCCNAKKKECHFHIYNSWESHYQRALGICMESSLIGGKLAGYCTRLFQTNCWAEQTAFACKGDPYDEFIVSPSKKCLEEEIEKLLLTDQATRADMAVAMQKLRIEVEEHKMAEAALHESEERFSQVATASGELIWEVDSEGLYTYVSPVVEKLYGYKPEEIVGKIHFYDIFPEEHKETWKKDILESFKRRTPFIDYPNAIINHRTGHKILLMTNAFPFFDQQGNLLGYRGLDLDVTERKKLEEQDRELIRIKAGAEIAETKSVELERAYTALKDTQEKLIRSEKLAVLGKLAGTLAHELRSPLGSIRNVSYLLTRELHRSENEKIRKYLRILEKEVKASDEIVNDVLSFGREQQANPSSTNANSVIKRSIQKVAVPQNIRVVLKLADGLPSVMINETRIEHVLVNLINNAIQAMPRGGQITVTSESNGENIIIHVTDTGEGISEENMKKIFEPLFSTKEHGFGLGLAICRSLLEINNGRINVRSKPGEGSTFTIALPVSAS